MTGTAAGRTSGRQVRRLHVVGPMPPPIGGATMTFQAFVEEVGQNLGRYGLDAVHVTDSAPRRLRTRHTIGFGEISRAIRVTREILKSPAHSDGLVFFTSERMFFQAAPALIGLRRRKMPVIVKLFGSSLPRTLRSTPLPLRRLAIRAFNAMTAVLCQTAGDCRQARELGVENVAQSPGFRPVRRDALPALPESGQMHPGLRVIHLGLVSRSKGVCDVVQAVEQLGRADITFDIFGDVDPLLSREWDQVLRNAKRCRYHGPFTGDPVALLAGYDLLALASSHAGEGHAGVVIEAMAAGIPALVSRHQGLPELVEDGVSGMVVPAHDVASLTSAFTRLADDPVLRRKMAGANRNRLGNHDAAGGAAVILGHLAGVPQSDLLRPSLAAREASHESRPAIPGG